MNRTEIEWADFVSNAIRAFMPGAPGRAGHACVKCSPGCGDCYAEGINTRFGPGQPYTAAGLKVVQVYFDEAELGRRLRFQPKAPFKNGRDRALVFLEDMSDAGGDWVKTDWLDRTLAGCALRPDVDWFWLTKRPARIAAHVLQRTSDGRSLRDVVCLVADAVVRKHVPRWHVVRTCNDLLQRGSRWPLDNVYFGFSAENQEWFDRRWREIRGLAAAGWNTWVSAEPLFGPIKLGRALGELRGVIVGGLSRGRLHPMHPAWPREIRDECESAGVPFHFKQWGTWKRWEPGDSGIVKRVAYDGSMHDQPIKAGAAGEPMSFAGKKRAGRMLDGCEHDAMPGTGFTEAIAVARQEPKPGVSRRVTHA